MALIATAELTLEAPLPLAFQHFIDYPAWDLWMPAVLRPIVGPARLLRAGDSITISLGAGARRIRTELNVIRLRPNRELCWRAGLAGVLISEHSFFFSTLAGKTALRSEEPFSGLLARRPWAGLIERLAVGVHEQILAGFAAHMRGLH